MEQEKRKLNLKIIIPVVIAIVVAIVIGIFIGRATMTTKEKDYVGTWKIDNNDDYYYQRIILYEGGTGKIIGINNYGEEARSPITWEIKGNTLNIDNGIMGIYGYRIGKDTMTTVDGEHTYNKVK